MPFLISLLGRGTIKGVVGGEVIQKHPELGRKKKIFRHYSINRRTGNQRKDFWFRRVMT